MVKLTISGLECETRAPKYPIVEIDDVVTDITFLFGLYNKYGDKYLHILELIIKLTQALNDSKQDIAKEL